MDEFEDTLVLEEAPHGFWCEHQDDGTDCPNPAALAILVTADDTAKARRYACTAEHAGEVAIVALMDGYDVEFAE